MERGESAGNRQSFSLGLGDHEYQTHSSKWEVDDCTIVGNASFKKSRLDDVELQHREDDAHKSFPGDICQSRSISGSHRAKGQSFWDTVLCDDDHRSGFSRTSMTNEENPKQSPQTGVSGHFETAGFDFPQAGGYAGGHSSSSGSVASWEVENSSREVIPLAGIGSWSGVAAVSYTGMGCFMGGTQSDGKGMSNLVSSVDQSLENIKRKGFVLDDHDREVHRTTGIHVGQVDYEISKLRTGVEGGEYLDSSIHSISLSPSEVEGEEKSFHLGSFSCSSVTHSSNNRPDHGPEERRSSCKRKSLTTGLPDRSPFQGSQSSLWRETLPATTGGTGSMRSDSNGLSSSANFSITSNDPTIQIWDESSSDGIGITCNAKEYFEPLRVSNGKVSTPDETDGFPMTLQDQSISMPQEPSHSQLHSLFARNLSRSMPAPHSQNLSRSIPAPHSQNLFSRRVSFTEQQVGQSGENSTSIADDIDQWSTLFGERNSISSVAATGDDINPSRRGNPVPRFIVRERASNVFEGSRMRGMSNRVSRVAGRALLDRSASRATSSQVLDGSTVRTTNSSETRVRTNQVANPFPDLGGASSALLSSSHRSGSINRNTPSLILPATVSGRPTLITSARQPRGSLAGLHSSGTRLPMFVDGRGEGIPEAPIQSILGLPFHGLHMLPADGEHRRRFLSEIISALEHAWRSEDINLQELVMLDPSLIYGGIDAHDQHSDMRLDVDNMSYEELLALEERIGDVSTGLSNEMISVCVRENKYSSLDATVAAMSQESDVKCSICQEEFVEEDELGRLDCGHGYHTLCIKQWLLQKNVCPVCKIPAYSKS